MKTVLKIAIVAAQFEFAWPNSISSKYRNFYGVHMKYMSMLYPDKELIALHLEFYELYVDKFVTTNHENTSGITASLIFRSASTPFNYAFALMCGKLYSFSANIE